MINTGERYFSDCHANATRTMQCYTHYAMLHALFLAASHTPLHNKRCTEQRMQRITHSQSWRSINDQFDHECGKRNFFSPQTRHIRLHWIYKSCCVCKWGTQRFSIHENSVISLAFASHSQMEGIYRKTVFRHPATPAASSMSRDSNFLKS